MHLYLYACGHMYADSGGGGGGAVTTFSFAATTVLSI